MCCILAGVELAAKREKAVVGWDTKLDNTDEEPGDSQAERYSTCVDLALQHPRLLFGSIYLHPSYHISHS